MIEKLSSHFSLPFSEVEVDLSDMKITPVSQHARKPVSARQRYLLLLTLRYPPVQSIQTI